MRMRPTPVGVVYNHACAQCTCSILLGERKMAAILLGDKRLSDLKVTELKAELDKRGLSKKGVKSVLVERLKKAILREELSNVSRLSFHLFDTHDVIFTSQLLL